jgi:addiction module HigA family antidote
MPRKLPPIHPGEVLREEFLKPLGLTKYRLAKATQVPADRIGKIVSGRRAITADTALRFARFFGTSAEFWMNLQARCDLETTRDVEGRIIAQEVQPMLCIA